MLILGDTPGPVRGDMLVPNDGEVAWVPPEGEKPYFRGHIIEIDHDFVR
jgi:hypothetical protein